MGHSIGDAMIVAALSALLFGYLYLKYSTRNKRLELIHQERLVAMEKDFPLPELPLDPPSERTPPDPIDAMIPLVLGIVLVMFGGGTMIVIRFAFPPSNQAIWVAPLPIVLVGIGLILVHRLTRPRGV